MFRLQIDTENDEFRGGVEEVLASMLEEVARRLRLGHRDSGLFDANGNRVGSFKLTSRVEGRK